MSELNLGSEIKSRRKNKKIGSRELSRKIGKAETYISQLERNLIKTPDFTTLYNIFKFLGHEEENIEDYLYNVFGLESKERFESLMMEADDREEIQHKEYLFQQDVEAYENELLENNNSEQSIEWLTNLEVDLKSKVGQTKTELNFFVDKNLDTFTDVIENFHKIVMSMRKDKKSYDLFTSLFKFDLTNLDDKSKDRIINLIKEECMKETK